MSDADRLAYGVRFVAACRSAGLGAVAITDHHDFAFFRHIRAAAQTEVNDEGELIEESDRLVVFPGLELTLGVPCQALLVLDAGLPLDRLPDVLAALSIEPIPDEDERLLSVARLDHLRELEEVHRALDLREGLQGRYILIPNVTDGGHGTLMRSGMHPKYRDMPCVGGYLDGTVDKVGKGNRNAFDGKDKSRGNKPLALFQTSDCRSGTFETLGRPSTWVKWSEPTAEALRQACLAEESRISHEEPPLPNVFIERLSISNSKFMGPVELSFNPQYNAVIGGRGTGKSSLLGYLRWALCDSSSVGIDDVDAGIGARDQRLIEATLGAIGASVDVHFSLNEIPHVVRRFAETGEVTLKIGADDFDKADPSEIRQLLPIQAYSQKQLSTVGVRLDELTRFVNLPIRRELQELDARIRDVEGRIRASYSTLQRYRVLDQSTKHLANQVRSLTDQAENLRSGLTGLSDSDTSTLDSKKQFDGVSAAVDAWDEAWDRAQRLGDRFEEVLKELIEATESVPLSDPESAEKLVDYHGQHSAALAELQLAAGDANLTFRNRRAASEPARVEVRRILQTYNESYEEVKLRSTAHASRLDELGGLEREQKEAESLLRSETLERDGLGDPSLDLAELFEELSSLRVQRSAAVEAQCVRLSDLSDGLIRTRLHRGQGLKAAQEAFRAFVPKSGMRAAKVDTLFEQLAAEEDPILTWAQVLDELEVLVSFDENTEITTEAAPTTARLGFAPADLKRVAGSGSPDGWLALALVPIEDHPVFEYRTRDSEYIRFVDASAGQQATALMRVLLADSGPPLVIDQPEDDLDSQVVQDIVERIWQAKRHRQLIFASHNANLVVNGDAELVAVCDYRIAGDQSGGRIKIRGAIDQADVRKEVATVMEGGEKAFRLRKAKYGF